MNSTTVHFPVCIAGAGGIVANAHLPAYRLAGYQVKGIMDLDVRKARTLAEKFAIGRVYESLAEMVADNGTQVVYDFALPASETLHALQQLPDRATVLIQKPLGESLAEAKAMAACARTKQLLAGVNFQLRFAPFVLEARKMIAAGLIGAITDIEAYVNVHTPWNLWSFLFDKPRMEILYHSIHYIDLIRSFLGNPAKVLARTFKHPQSPQLASVRSNIILDYGDWVRAAIHTHHNHDFGEQGQESYIKIEGTLGVIKMTLGALINYPHGAGDSFHYITKTQEGRPEWQSKAIAGTWFPHAFIGTMEQMQLSRAGILQQPENNIEDACRTMACVEAAYLSNERSGVPVSDIIYQ